MEENLQYYFDIADALLRDLDGVADVPPSDTGSICRNCRGCQLVLCYADGCYVCTDCGEVSMQPVFERAHMFLRKFSNYKRIHHFHERISQFMLSESSIAQVDVDRIKTEIQREGIHTINKTIIRKILRSLGMQRYIEKWLQIVWKVTGMQPPQFSARVCMQLDILFIAMQLPFMSAKPQERKNFLNYNYVFNRLLQKLDLTEFCMFFPLIKSKSKLAILDQMWQKICETVKWEYHPLKLVKPFSIRI